MCILFLPVSCLTPISKTPRNHDNQRRQMPSKCQKNFSSRSCVRPPGACRGIIAFQGLGFLSIATTTTSIRRSRTRERNLQYNILVVKFEKIFQEKGPQTQSKTKTFISSFLLCWYNTNQRQPDNTTRPLQGETEKPSPVSNELFNNRKKNVKKGETVCCCCEPNEYS